MSVEITPETPAMVPPEGQKSNFTNPPDYYHLTLAIGVTSMVIMIVSVYMRSYTKIIILKDVKHEDIVAIIALLGFVAWNSVYIYIASLGITRDLWNIRAMDMSHLLYLMNCIQVLYGPTMLCAKYFIIVQLRRIFCPPGPKGAVYWVLNTLVAASAMYYTACFFVFLFQCVPRERIWNPAVPGTCVDQNGAVMSAGTINFALDIGVFVVPLWAIWHLQMPLKRKIGVVSVFTVGFVTCGMAAAGVAYRVPLLTVANQTNAIAKVGLWTFAEYTGTIVVGCMPMMPRFYQVSLKPNISRLSKTSLNSLSLFGRSKASQSGTIGLSGSTSSNVKPISKFVISHTLTDEEHGHEYIKLQEPSFRSDTSHNPNSV